MRVITLPLKIERRNCWTASSSRRFSPPTNISILGRQNISFQSSSRGGGHRDERAAANCQCRLPMDCPETNHRSTKLPAPFRDEMSIWSFSSTGNRDTLSLSWNTHATGRTKIDKKIDHSPYYRPVSNEPPRRILTLIPL